jgi:SAM-dependent methyltransferase
VTGNSSPLDLLSPHALFGAVDDETWRWLHLEGRTRCPFLTRYLPSHPGDAVEGRINDKTGLAALETGFRIYAVFKHLYEAHGGTLLPTSRVLDFGCGWGRLTRFFLRDVEPGNLVGIDVDETAIADCRETNPWCRFERSTVLPPSGLDSGSFDLVYAYSVYSHLSEEAHLRWLEEFERLLRPGGILLLTTLGRGFIERSAQWASADPAAPLVSWKQRAAGLFFPANDWTHAYDRGDFCYRAIDERANPHFGFACISESYVRTIWSRYFVIREFRPPQADLQAVIVCQKRPVELASGLE